jgi:hypothetical protein
LVDLEQQKERVMILPTIRASLSRSDAQQLVGLLGRGDSELAEAAQRRLDESGIGSLLDDPRIQNALLADADVSVSPQIIFYVLVRQALLEGGIDDENTSDYVASMLFSFGEARRAYRISGQEDSEFHYLTDIVSELRSADGRRRFLLRVHMGDFALWMSGLFPDYLEARTRRKGAPPIPYFEEWGATGYLGASESAEAGELGLDTVLRDVAIQFSAVRTALNRISDRHFWPGSGDPVGRLLREVAR